jgi:hypothetical protein
MKIKGLSKIQKFRVDGEGLWGWDLTSPPPPCLDPLSLGLFAKTVKKKTKKKKIQDWLVVMLEKENYLI